jgi:hypothetical protein
MINQPPAVGQMNEESLLRECKIGLGLPEDSSDFDAVIKQKILAVKSFMSGAGVSAALMEDDLATGVIVLGVTDLWSMTGGEVNFSPVFYILLNQLSVRSGV